MLQRLGFETAALDAKLLTGHALGLSSLDMALREHEAVSEAAAQRVADLLQRRLTGESVGRIVGGRAFYGLDFMLNAATLEPRPETELLVDLALKTLPQGGRLLDLGTGTGCIPIAILANRPDASAVAVDLSAEALDAARENAGRHGVGGRLKFLQGSWFEPLFTSPSGENGDFEGSAADPANPSTASSPRRRGSILGNGFVRMDSHLRGNDAGTSTGGEREGFHLITSNPPYIASAVLDTLAPEVKDFDPRLALDGGPDGLAPYRIIAAEASRWLRPGGTLLLEIGHDQGAAVSALLTQAGFGALAVHPDLNGLDRVVCAHHIRRSDTPS